MSEEERKALIINLRWLGQLDHGPEIAQPCLKAADEIERLAARDTTSRDLIGALTYENKRAADEIERLAALLKKYEENQPHWAERWLD